MGKLLNLKLGAVFNYIEERVTRSQFTDGGGAAGTYTMKEQIPVGACVLQTQITDVVGFIGDTSAVVRLGDGSDADRYNTGAPSVFATAVAVEAGIPSGVRAHTAAIAPVVTVTSAADFTAVTAGAMTVRVVYLA